MPAFRRAAELKAGPVLVVLSRLPPAALFVGVLVLLVGGLLLGGLLGLLLVGVVAAFMGLQVFFAWPVLAPPQRLLRAATLVLVLAAALRNT